MENSQLPALRGKLQNSQQNKISQSGFLVKLKQILENKEFSGYVSWNDTGKGILIKDQDKFEKLVLPQVYNQSKFSSFVRQLNMYHFNKKKDLSGYCCYSNPLFTKDSKDFLSKVSRKKVHKREEKVQSCASGERLPQLEFENEALSEPTKKLKTELDHAYETIRWLQADNQRLREQIQETSSSNSFSPQNPFYQSSVNFQERSALFGSNVQNYVMRPSDSENPLYFQHRPIQNLPVPPQMNDNYMGNSVNTFQMQQQQQPANQLMPPFGQEGYSFQDQNSSFQSQYMNLQHILQDTNDFNFKSCSTQGSSVKNSFPQESLPYQNDPYANYQNYYDDGN